MFYSRELRSYVVKELRQMFCFRELRLRFI